MNESKDNLNTPDHKELQDPPLDTMQNSSVEEKEAEDLEVLEYTPDEDEPEEYVPLYKKTWFIWFSLILFAPIGVFFLWKYTSFKPWYKIIISIIFLGYFIYTLVYPDRSLFGI